MHVITDEWPLEELQMWRVWMQEPRGETRADWHAAQISHMVWQISQMFSKVRRRIPVGKFLLKFSRPADSSAYSQLSMLSRAFGGIVPKEDLRRLREKERQRLGLPEENVSKPLQISRKEGVEQMRMLTSAFGIDNQRSQ